MEVFRGNTIMRDSLKVKRKKRPFQGSVDFSSTSVRQGRNLLKSQSLQLIRYHVCVAKKVELPFK